MAWLTIDRPDARNAVNRAVRDGLHAGVRRFNDDDSAKVLVLTGDPISAERAPRMERPLRPGAVAMSRQTAGSDSFSNVGAQTWHPSSTKHANTSSRPSDRFTSAVARPSLSKARSPQGVQRGAWL